MSVTATYNQITSTTNTWIGTFQIGGVYYAIKDPNLLYRIETDGTATYLRAISGNVWGAVCCDGTYIYRASSTTIFKINPADGTVPYSSACANLRCLGIDTAGSRIFGLTNSGALYVFTLNNMTQYYVNNVGSATYGGKMVYLNGALYIPTYGGKIKKYVVDTGVTSTLNNSLSAGWLCLDTDGQYIYGTVDGGRIYRIYPDDSATYEEVQGDSAGRFWYSNTYYNGQIWANAYNGYCYKIALPVPAVPTASPSTSTIWTDTAVTLSCATSGATIKYTLDGSTPGLSAGTTYSAPFTISATTTIKFCAIKDGYVTAGTDVVLTWAPIFTQLTSITGSEFQWICIAYYNGVLYGVLYDNAVVKTIDPTLYSINPTTGALTSLATLASVPFNMVIGGDKIYMIGNAGKNVREYNLSGTLLNTYVCDPGTELTGLNGITYLNGKVYAFSGTSYPKSYFFEITPGNTTVNTISYTGTFSQYCNGQTWTDGTYIYYTNNYSVYRVNPTTGATTLFGTVSNQDIDSKYNTYLNGSLIVRVGFSGSDTLGVCNSSEAYSRFMPFPNPNSIAIWNMTNDGTYIYGASGTGTAKIYKIRAFLDLGTPSIYNSGSWKTEKSLYVRNNSTWKLANKAFKVKNGLWTRIY